MMVGSAWQCQRPLRSAGPLSIQSQNKGWSGEQAPQVHFVQPSHTLSFKHWHIATQGAIHSQHCLGQVCVEDHTAARAHGCNTRPQMRPDMQLLCPQKYIRP